MKNPQIRYEGFYSKYPYKAVSRKKKEILYDGPIDDLPEEYEEYRTDTLTDGHKFCIVYKIQMQ